MVGVAQLVEHRIVAPGVVGSIPIVHPIFKMLGNLSIVALVAILFADVVELVDTLDLGSSAARCESSSLSVRTISLSLPVSNSLQTPVKQRLTAQFPISGSLSLSTPIPCFLVSPVVSLTKLELWDTQMQRKGIKRRPMADAVLASLEPEPKEYRELDIAKTGCQKHISPENRGL